jgi:hypothetical protein
MATHESTEDMLWPNRILHHSPHFSLTALRVQRAFTALTLCSFLSLFRVPETKSLTENLFFSHLLDAFQLVGIS